MIKKIFVILFICIGFTTKVFSYDAEKISISNNGAYIKDVNIQELQKFYADLEFPNYLKPNDNIYPRVFVKNVDAIGN